MNTEAILEKMNQDTYQTYSRFFGSIFIIGGAFLICFFFSLILSVIRKDASRKREGDRSLEENSEFIIQKEINGRQYIEKGYTRKLYTDEKGWLKLMAEPDDNRYMAGLSLFCIFLGAVGMILLGLHILNPEQLLMGSLGRQFLFVFVAFLAFVMILRGKNTLRMRYKSYPEDDGRWLKGRVIRVERAMAGFGRYREGRRIVVEYSDNGLLYYLHRDTHVYRINKCPKRGDKVDILFSSILTKAITRAEVKDAKYKIFKGVLILLLILLLWLYYFFR